MQYRSQYSLHVPRPLIQGEADASAIQYVDAWRVRTLINCCVHSCSVRAKKIAGIKSINGESSCNPSFGRALRPQFQ